MGNDAPLSWPVVPWTVVIPVKLLALAKSRLSDLADDDRKAVALAMAADTVTAAVTCPPVGDVIVVSDDPAVRTEAEAAGAALTADLPALSAAELAVALTAASGVSHAFVADAAGSGTTLYTAMPGVAFE